MMTSNFNPLGQGRRCGSKGGRVLVLLTLMLVTLAGCASMDASNQRSLLSAAGFRARVPETPKQRELYAAAEPYKVLQGNRDGKSFYAYKDEKNGVAYVGGEAEYQRYQQLAIQQKIASDNYMAAQMNRDASWGWYGAYDPFVFRPRVAAVRRR